MYELEKDTITHVHLLVFRKHRVEVAQELHDMFRRLTRLMGERYAVYNWKARTSGSSWRYLFEAVYENPVPAGWSTGASKTSRVKGRCGGTHCRP